MIEIRDTETNQIAEQTAPQTTGDPIGTAFAIAEAEHVADAVEYIGLLRDTVATRTVDPKRLTRLARDLKRNRDDVREDAELVAQLDNAVSLARQMPALLAWRKAKLIAQRDLDEQYDRLRKELAARYEADCERLGRDFKAKAPAGGEGAIHQATSQVSGLSHRLSVAVGVDLETLRRADDRLAVDVSATDAA